MAKKYGFIIGRFAPLTLGHEKLIKYALENVDVLLIFVGSADKKGTVRNPFDVNLRIELIEKVYKEEIENGKIIVKPLLDMTNENDYKNKKWGSYLLSNVSKYIIKEPYYFIYGEEESREEWFSNKDLEKINKLVIKRNKEDISGTKVRKYIVSGDKENFEKNTNKKIHEYYEKLREELLKIDEYIK